MHNSSCWDPGTLPLTNLNTACFNHAGNLSLDLRVELAVTYYVNPTFCVYIYTDFAVRPEMCVPALPHSSSVTLGKLLNLSEPKCPCL